MLFSVKYFHNVQVNEWYFTSKLLIKSFAT
jgi:hypothetical protein